MNRRLITIGVLACFTTTSALGAPKSTAIQPPKIPSSPSAPPSFVQTAPSIMLFHCPRSFTLEGRTYDCDSLVARDGARLSQVVSAVPEAAAELKEYRNNRMMAQNAAYVTTGSVTLIVLGALLGRIFFGPGTHSATVTRDLSTYAGLFVGFNSLLFSVSLIHNNDIHLTRAVNAYNQARPDNPIGIEISTSLDPTKLFSPTKPP